MNRKNENITTQQRNKKIWRFKNIFYNNIIILSIIFIYFYLKDF
jgi:hypothetical protein